MLTRVVAQPIPVFVLSCFLLPQEIGVMVESVVCQFWWGSKGDKRNIHWVQKDKLLK